MFAILLAFALSISGSQADTQARDARAIAAAKNTSVRRLDPSLPEKSLAKWLREVVGPQAPIAWEVNDCGEQTGNPEADKGRDFPICVEAQVRLSQKSTLSVAVSVGTAKTGVQPPSVGLAYAVIVGPDGSTRSIRKLSQAPEAINRLRRVRRAKSWTPSFRSRRAGKESAFGSGAEADSSGQL